MSGGNGSFGLGSSSYGSSGCVVVLRVFFLFRLCVDFFGGFAEPAPASLVLATSPLPLPAFELSAFEIDVTVAALPAALEPAVDVVATFAALEPEPALLDDDEPALLDDDEPALFADEPEPALLGFAAEPEPALFVVVDEPLPLDADGLGADDKPSASKYAPAPASARSTSTTVMMRPMRRFGGAAIESSVDLGRCCDVGFMLCADTGATPFLDCAGVGIACAVCGLLGPRCTLGVSGYDAGGAARSWLGVRCATWCAGVCTGCAPVSIFCVGGSAGASRAPQPPQNRESGSLSVPQLEQRIPP